MESCCTVHSEMGQINTTGLKTLLDAKTPLILVDARESVNPGGRRIPGSISVAGRSLEEALLNKDSLIVVYCTHIKCGASGRLAKRLEDAGYRFVLKYPDGVDGWAQAGHSTISI